MNYKEEIIRRYQPTEGETFYIYRTFSGRIIVLNHMTSAAELVRMIKWVA